MFLAESFTIDILGPTQQYIYVHMLLSVCNVHIVYTHIKNIYIYQVYCRTFQLNTLI